MIIASQHKINIPIKKILIIQLGDIGDVVWGIPAYRSVKLAYPQAQLFIITREPNGDLLLDDPHFTRIFQIKNNLCESFNLMQQLRKLQLDLVIDLRSDDRGAYMAFFSKAKMRAALYYPGLTWRNRMFTHLVNEPIPEKGVYGAAEQSLIIMRGLGMKEETSIPGILTTDELKNKIRNLLNSEKLEAKHGWISINPFSRWSYKEWGKDKWIQLLSFIWRQYAMPTIIIGSAAERQRAAELIEASQSPVYNFAGKTTLREMAALLQMSRLHIGVDSAAPHIAAAVGTQTLTIYGPTDWRDWAPPGEKNKVVLPDMPCSPCYRKGCEGKGISQCLDNLPVDKVQKTVAAMLDNQIYAK